MIFWVCTKTSVLCDALRGNVIWNHDVKMSASITKLLLFYYVEKDLIQIYIYIYISHVLCSNLFAPVDTIPLGTKK